MSATTATVRSTFDLGAVLPTGTTVLEASAGTGKTHAIVALAARYVADGVPIGSLLLVTFSRMATAELRERTRERLRSVAIGLADPNAPADELVDLLRRGAPTEIALRESRVAAALSDFDAATVSTTHTFCSRMLDALGIAGERDRGITLVEEVDELVAEVAGDVYLKWFSGQTTPLFGYAEAVAIAKGAVRQTHAGVVPADPVAGSEADQRVRFVTAVRAEVIRRKRLMGIRDYDELQSMLREVLTDPERGAAARARIRALFSVVLVDEFQDTDPIQWEILRACFHGHTTLILVGDPKQSIYKFRGAEVLSYLDAARSADAHQALSTNWRTDAGLVSALDHLYGAAELGHPDIVVRTVDAAHREPRLPGRTPLRLRYLSRAGHGPVGKAGFPTLANLRAAVVVDVAADVARLLAAQAPYADPGGRSRPIRPADIVILLHRRVTIAPMQRALRDVGIASVVGAGSSVFTTTSARDWFHLLRAVEQPTRVDRVVLASLTPLIGRTPAQMDSARDDAVAEVGELMSDLAQTLTDSGFAAMYEQLAMRTGLQERILSAIDGERTMTDIDHLASLCNRHLLTESRGPAGLLRWFADRLDDPQLGDQSEQSRRLDRDAQAVSIMTVHGSKGLEFPVVYVPFGWDAARNPSLATIDLHDPAGRRVIDVGGEGGPGRRANAQIAENEDAGEALRLFYVAVTRARSEVVLWWAPSTATARSPLHRLLFARPDRGSAGAGADPAPTARIPADTAVGPALSAWAAPAGALISVRPSGDEPAAAMVDGGDHSRESSLAAARLDRAIDHDWRRTSYSALVADQHDATVIGDDHDGPAFTDDEPDEPRAANTESAAVGDPGVAMASLMNGLPGGAAFGTLVHAILEDIDTDVDDLAAEVDEVCARQRSASGLEMDPEILSAAVLAVLRTPLGRDIDLDLASIATSDRLCEVDFEFALRPTSAAPDTLAAVADLLEEHLAPADPLSRYPDRLRSIPAVAMRGFLTGSIDAVLRVGSTYVVVDYKTNRLGLGALTVDDYTESAMAQEMIRSHYPLQALLYSVALHRYLRWRVPGYRPEIHLGPVKYLFVRAMVGTDTPPGRGVFEWNPPARLVTAVSDLLGGL